MSIEPTTLKGDDRLPPTATVITTGSELMLGQMADTNSAWLSAWLSERGITVVRHVSVGDDLPALTAILAEASRLYEVTVVTGGLGPTEDDLTRLAVSKALGRPLEYHPELAQWIVSFMTSRGYSCTANNLRQGWLPGGSILVENPWGTAPAFCLAGRESLMLFMPGVPQEMKNIVASFLGPKLEETFPTRVGHHRTTILRAAGLGESRVDSLLSDLIRGSTNPVLGLLAGPYETKVLITSKARNPAEAERLEAPIVAEAIRRLGPNYVGRDGQTMVTSICAELAKRSLRFGVADSFTNGLAATNYLQALNQENLAGTLAVVQDSLPEAVNFLFQTLAADLVGVISDPGPPGPRSSDQELSARVRILGRNPAGGPPVELATAENHFGRTQVMALTRAGALMTLLLWTYFKNLNSAASY
jgi:nicotinamide-nucleotide amidase